jgi:hypothetical protein
MPNLPYAVDSRGRRDSAGSKRFSPPAGIPGPAQPSGEDLNSSQDPSPAAFRLIRCPGREEYGAIEYGGLPIKYSVFIR